MSITIEIVGFAITLFSFCAGILASVWRISTSVAQMRSEVRDYITAVKHELQLKDAYIERLQDKVTLGLNGLLEKFNHFSTRSRSELNSLDARLEDVEEFLAKTTDFTRRR